MRSPLSHVAGVLAAFPTLLAAQGPWLHAPMEMPPALGVFQLLGDVDLDGDLDAIAFEYASGGPYKASFTVHRNNGTGTFTPGVPTPLPAGAGMHALLADVDGDGRGDLILSVVNGTPTIGLLIFPGLAGGAFGASQFLPLPGLVLDLTSGNGNGDGITDLLVLHGGPFPGHTRWLFGAAGFALTLGPAVVLPLSSDLDAVDADGDGLDDVALPIDSGPGPADMLWFQLTTPTGFVPGPIVTLPDSFTFHVAALDHDGDGDRDLVVHNAPSSGSGTSLTICSNLGGGNWGSTSQTFVGGTNGILHIGDWNGDGRDDLGIRTFESGGAPNRLGLYESVTGGFSLRYQLPIGATADEGGAGFGDLDLDGRLDFLDGGSVWFGDGTFTLPFGTNNTGALRDWDGDGDQDLLPHNLSLHDGNGGATSALFTFPPLPANHVYDITRLVTDLDGDGRHEILVGVLEVFFLQTTFKETHLLREVTDQQFTFVGLAAPAPARLDRGVTDDTDGDGDLDIVNRDGLWLNNGAGFFTLQGAITTGYEPLATGDVDGDGDQDLLATTTGGGTSLAVLHRTAPNTWSTTVLFPPVTGAIESIAPNRFFDVDDDGDLDVVARERQASNVWRTRVFTNHNGVFTQALILPHFGPVLVGDVDGDGLSDLAFSEASRLRVLRRVGPGLVYAPPVTFVAPPRNDLVDFDQDGDLDATGSQGVVRNRRFHGPSAGHRRQYGNGSLGAGGWRPILSMRGPIREGLTPTMSLRRAPGGTFALLVLGSGAINAPSIVLPGVQSYVAPIDALIGFTLNGALGQPGAGSIDLPLAIPIGLGGVHAFVEFVVFDPTVPGAFTHSNGCELAIGQ